MAKPVRVVFNADTGQFVSQVDGATKAVNVQGEAVAAAKNKVLEFGKAQLKTAEEAGASQKELQRIYDQTLSQITSVSETNAQRVIAGKDRIIEKNREVAESQKQLAQVFAMPIAVEHDDVTNKQRASAVLRGGGVRAGEQFLTQFEVFNKFATIAFPVLGAAALGKEVFHIAEGLHKVYEEAEKTGQALNDAFEQSHSKAQVTIDDLTVQADKLQDNIDKLHGHPGDGLKTGLDEARRYADKLRESLVADRTELEKLFKEHNVGTFGSVLSGVATTGKQHEELLQDHRDVEQQIDHIIGQYGTKAAKAANLDEVKSLGKQRDSSIDAALQAPIDRYRVERERLQKEQADSERLAAQQNQLAASQGRAGVFRPIDNSAKIAGIDLASGRYQDFVGTFRAQNHVADLTEQNLKAEQDKANEKLAKEGSSKAREAERKAAEEQRKQWEVELAAMQANGKLSASATLTLWIDRENATRKGSENNLLAEKEGFKALREVHEEEQKNGELAELRRRQFFSGLEGKQVIGVVEPGINANAKGKLDAARTADELNQARQRAADTVAEATIQYEQQAGAISRHDAALRMQTLHTEEYRRALARLQEQLDAVQDGPEAEAQRNKIRTQMTDLDAKRSVEVMQDAANKAATTWQGALQNASAAWLQNATDTAKQVQELFSQTINGVNDNLVEAMTGGKTDWSGMFKGLSKTLAKDALERAEAPVMKALGLGKNDGSDDNPWAVKIVGGGAGGLGGVFGGKYGDSGLGGLKKMFSGGDDDDGDDDDDDSEGMGGFLKKAAGWIGKIFGGHKALGGPVKAGVTYDVGEMGREEFTPKTDGYITPNNQRGGNTTLYIDATGSTDPAQVEAAAHRVFQSYLPGIQRSAAPAVREDNKRLPPNRRK